MSPIPDSLTAPATTSHQSEEQWPLPHDQPQANNAPNQRPAVSVIVPTFNEAESVEATVASISKVLDDNKISHEIIVVDDNSPDRTWHLVQRVAGRDHRVRLIKREGERGLSSAVMAGMAQARGIALAVIDGDGQHDERILPLLAGPILNHTADICVASRSGPGGSYGSFKFHRRAISLAGATLARYATGIAMSDPMSGYFVVSRTRFEAVGPLVNARGFKVLLELAARGRTPRVVEVGYEFRTRSCGTTKLTAMVGASFLVEVCELSTSRLMSRFRPHS